MNRPLLIISLCLICVLGLKGFINKYTIRSLFPQDSDEIYQIHKDLIADKIRHALPIDAPILRLIFGELEELIRGILLIENLYDGCDPMPLTYIEELEALRGLFLNPDQHNKIFLENFKKALANHAMVSCALFSHDERKMFDQLFWGIDILYQALLGIPRTFTLEVFALQLYKEIDASFIEIYPQGIYSPNVKGRRAKPYFFHSLEKVISSKSDGSKLRECFLTIFLERMLIVFDEKVKEVEKVKSISGWLNVHKRHQEKDPFLDHMIGTSGSTMYFFNSYFLGPIPCAPKPDMVLRTFMYHYNLVLKQITLYAKRKDTFEVPASLNYSIIDMLSHGVQAIFSIIVYLEEVGLLGRLFGDVLSRSLGEKFNSVCSMQVYALQLVNYVASMNPILSSKKMFANTGFILNQQTTVELDFLMFDIMIKYFELKRQRRNLPFYDEYKALFSRLNERFPVKFENYPLINASEKYRLVHVHFTFFILSLHLHNRPPNYELFPLPVDKASVYHAFALPLAEADKLHFIDLIKGSIGGVDENLGLELLLHLLNMKK